MSVFLVKSHTCLALALQLVRGGGGGSSGRGEACILSSMCPGCSASDRFGRQGRETVHRVSCHRGGCALAALRGVAVWRACASLHS